KDAARGCRPIGLPGLLRICQVRHALTRKSRCIILLFRYRLHIVAASNQKPLLVVFFQPDEIPFAGELFSTQDEMKFSLRQVLRGCLAFGLKSAVIPPHPRPASILSFRNDSFEVPIGNGMIFDMHRKSFFTLGKRYAFRYSP